MTGARPVLRLVDPAPGVHIVRQAIEDAQGDFGDAEHLTLAAPPGTSAALGYALPQATVLPEQRLEAWVWCNRPGAQLAAVVELPRSPDPATGRNRQLLVRSGVVAKAGGWQQLALGDVPTLLTRQARIARLQYRCDISELGAFVTHLVVLVPGGVGPTEVWVDQVALYGPLRPGGAGADGGGTAAPPLDLAKAWAGEVVLASGSEVQTPRGAPPAMPRIIQWQGEPFDLLARLGFDAVWMGRLPNAPELSEANRLGLWLVCPPPPPETLAEHGLGSEYDGVLAWDLGELASAADVELAEQWARALQRHERRPDRPTVLRPRAMAREASRIADIIVLGRPTMGSTASWLEYSSWLTHARRMARPGVGVWLAIDTQRSSHALAQLAALRSGAASPGAATYRHLSQSTAAAVGVWPRGFWFLSQSSLAAADADARARSLALELTNLRLGLIEPWLSRGKAAAAAQSSDPELTAMVLKVERSHLVIPMRWSDAAGGSAGTPPGPRAPGVRGAAQPVTIVLPGVPESCEAYLLTVAGPRQLNTRRVTGGLSVTVDELADDSFLLLTEDGYAYTQVERYLRRCAGRAAQARVELAALRRQEAVGVASRLSPAGLQAVNAAPDLAAIDAAMAAIHRTLVSQDFAAAFARAAASDRMLDRLEARLFAAMWPDGAAGASPVRGEWSTLVDLERAAAFLGGAGAAPIGFAAGEFEDLPALLDHGWRRSEALQPGVAGTVRLSPEAPHGGTYCLELEARMTASGPAPALTTPPVWITSPPLVAPTACLIEIRGWARVAETPIGSADPLLVFDSLGGEESAVRIASGPSWQPFRLVRVAAPGAECRVTVALGGVGRAAVDSLEYRVIPLPAALAARPQ